MKTTHTNMLRTAAIAAALGLAMEGAMAGHSPLAMLSSYVTHATQESHTIKATGSQEVAFSPNEGAQALVIKVIDAAQSEICVMAYSFTSAPVVQALLRAKKRGVNDIKLVVDYKSNVVEDRSGKARAALSALSNAGVDVRTINVYPIAHDKVLVTDRSNTETGSFNYSDAAARKNSENVIVNWTNPELASIYLSHFERNYRQSQPYSTRY